MSKNGIINLKTQAHLKMLNLETKIYHLQLAREISIVKNFTLVLLKLMWVMPAAYYQQDEFKYHLQR